jgi:translation initiation factor 2B subunit (eIF-2B alpha/beta/delta family)
MEIGIIATSAVSLLVRFTSKLLGETVDDLTDAAVEKAKSLYETLKSKFAADDYASETLNGLRKAPGDQRRQAAMRGILEESLKSDPGFVKTLQKIVEDAKAAGAVIQTGSGVQASNHSVAAGHGGIAVGGDFNMNK